MEQNNSNASTGGGETLPQTEVPQHILDNSVHGGPQFNETVAPQPNRLFSVLEDAKTNGWGFRLFSWIRENRQLLLGISGSLILAVIAITAIRSYVPTPALTIDNDVPALATSIEGALANDTISIDPASTLGSGSVVTQEVVPGDGITHLARRAVTARLLAQGLVLSPEQRIYAEDFVQNAIGTHSLSVGEKLSFPNILIDSAILGAQTLNEAQLQNLSQYTAQVIF